MNAGRFAGTTPPGPAEPGGFCGTALVYCGAVGSFWSRQPLRLNEKRRLSLASQSSRSRAATLSSLPRSEEHTSELQSLMRISYAVFCLKKQTTCNEYI